LNAGELLLRHTRIDARVRALAAEVRRLESALAGDARIEEARRRVDEARERQRELATRLRDRDREVEDHRARLRARDRELMSGRIHNPTELTKLSAEVEHMRARIASEEDAELELMEQLEEREAALREAEAELAALEAAREAATPALQRDLERARRDLAAAQTERDAAWAAVPAEYQNAARRIRVHPPVAEVTGVQCAECRVQITSNGLQLLRRGELVTCDNCGRVLVLG